MENGRYEAFCIEGGRKQFYRWDLNQKIVVNDPAIDEVHFCNGTTEKSMVSTVKDGRANVPNVLLQEARKIKVYGYSVDHTKVEKIYEVKDRTKPEDYVYEEAEVYRWAELDKRLTAIETAEEYELFLEGAIKEHYAAVSYYADPDITPNGFKLKKCIIEIEHTGENNASIILYCGKDNNRETIETVAKIKETFTPDKRYAALDIRPDGAYWNGTFYAAADAESTREAKGMSKDMFMKNRIGDIPYIDVIRIEADREKGTSPLPAGMIVRGYGVMVKE